MERPPFTPRNVAKFVVRLTIQSKVAKVAEDAITEHSRFEEDDLMVEIPAQLLGWYVSGKLKPLTDKMVDKTADFVVAKREARRTKKDNTETEK